MPLPKQEAAIVSKALLNEFICRFGTPMQIHSDQGTHFESQLFKEFCKLFHFHKSRTTSMRPHVNGNVERFNRTLENMQTMYCSKHQNTWDEYLQQVMMAYRASIQTSTKQSPNSMVSGHENIIPMQQCYLH